MNRKLTKKLFIVVLIIGLVAAFKTLNLDQFLTLEYLKSSRDQFTGIYTDHQLTVISAYLFIYVAVTALSLPGALVMTLAGGALFGFWLGTIIVSFASTIGATLACLVARFLLREWVQTRFNDRLKTINDGIAREGAFYLFTLRLVPIFPFFIINLAMGLTEMRLFTFYWISQIGMLAGTMVYVNAGKELSKIDSLSGILSPGLIISFVILGCFPITVKKLLAFYKSQTGEKT